MRPRTVTVALAGVLVLGSLLRLSEYFANRPLWLDELMLAVNIGRRSFAGLLRPLSYDQSAPVLFLWGVKILTLLAGMGEYSLRLLPLLGGLLLPWVVWRMARLLAGADVALIAAALTAVSVPLIHYAGELKPYSSDALVCVTVLLLALRIRQAPAASARWWQFGLGGLLGLLFSIPAPFVLAGAGAALVADSGVRGAPGARRRFLLVFASWAIGFGILYLTSYHAGETNPYLRRFWEDTFLDPHAPDRSVRLFLAGKAIFGPVTLFPDSLAMRWSLAAFLLGLVVLARRTGLTGSLLVAVPFVAVTVAAALGRYPMAVRLCLFLAPLVFLTLALLGAEVFRLARFGEGAVGVAGAALVLGLSARGVIANGRDPAVLEEGRETAKFTVRASAKEPVYILARALAGWAYYSTDWAHPDTTRLDRFAFVSRANGPAAFNSLVAEEPDDAAGKNLLFRSGARVDLIGARPGVSMREPIGYTRAIPDSGWAEREVDRIVAVARPYAWVYGSYFLPVIVENLKSELRRRGIVTVVSMQERRVIALRIRVPPKRCAAPGSC